MPKFTACNTPCAPATYLCLLWNQGPFAFLTVHPTYPLGQKITTKVAQNTLISVLCFHWLNKYEIEGAELPQNTWKIHEDIFVKVRVRSLPFFAMGTYGKDELRKNLFILCCFSQGIYKSVFHLVSKYGHSQKRGIYFRNLLLNSLLFYWH